MTCRVVLSSSFLARFSLFSISKQFVELCKVALSVLSPAFALSTDLAIAQVVIRIVYLERVSWLVSITDWSLTHISCRIFHLLELLLKLRDGLVSVFVHDCHLSNGDHCGNNQVAVEEFLGAKSTASRLISQSEEEEHSSLRNQSVFTLLQLGSNVLTEASNAPVTRATMVPA